MIGMEPVDLSTHAIKEPRLWHSMEARSLDGVLHLTFDSKNGRCSAIVGIVAKVLQCSIVVPFEQKSIQDKFAGDCVDLWYAWQEELGK